MAPSPSRKCAKLLDMLEVCTGDLVEVALRDGSRFFGRVVEVGRDALVLQGYSFASGRGSQGGQYLVIVPNVAYVRRIGVA